ncbi:hypothetical protein [Roseovarius sp. D0-M9]|uniref:hypothetical protein n=1 Tax=Roseovarius sp. D0-M9 TaxID=3127117 RepID=UPI0030104CD0
MTHKDLNRLWPPRHEHGQWQIGIVEAEVTHGYPLFAHSKTIAAHHVALAQTLSSDLALEPRACRSPKVATDWRDYWLSHTSFAGICLSSSSFLSPCDRTITSAAARNHGDRTLLSRFDGKCRFLENFALLVHDKSAQTVAEIKGQPPTACILVNSRFAETGYEPVAHMRLISSCVTLNASASSPASRMKLPLVRWMVFMSHASNNFKLLIRWLLVGGG